MNAISFPLRFFDRGTLSLKNYTRITALTGIFSLLLHLPVYLILLGSESTIVIGSFIWALLPLAVAFIAASRMPAFSGFTANITVTACVILPGIMVYGIRPGMHIYLLIFAVWNLTTFVHSRRPGMLAFCALQLGLYFFFDFSGMIPTPGPYPVPFTSGQIVFLNAFSQALVFLMIALILFLSQRIIIRSNTLLAQEMRELESNRELIARQTAQLYDLNSDLLIREDELQRALAQIEIAATTDKLTGLPNRRKFDEIIQHEIERAHRFNHPLSMAIGDIDLFKQINDRHGHLTGDAVLVTIAAAIAGSKRSFDIIARWGGEEFIVLLPNTALDGALHSIDRIRVSVEESQRLVHPFPVTISFGVTQLTPDDTIDSFLARADQALYAAKNGGRNRVCCRE